MLARVEALVAGARASGLVEVGDDAAPYVAPDDARVAEHVPYGPGWARYTLRLHDGTVVLEGGARRVWLASPDVAHSLTVTAARAAVESAPTLHRMLTLHLRVACGGESRTPIERAIQQEGLVSRLEERIRERAPIETQRIVDPDLLARLLSVVPDDALRRRLTGDRTLPDEVLATLGAWPERPDPAAALEVEVQRRLLAGDRALDATVAPPVSREAAAGAVSGGERWWALGVRLPDGAIQLDGGARRLLVAAPPVAERLVARAVAAALGDPDLRVALHHRARARAAAPTTDLHRALAASPSALKALDARIRALAESATADPPLSGEAVEMLLGAGVPEGTVRRLRCARDLPAEEIERLQIRTSARPRAVAASERLEALIAERTRAGWTELRDDAPWLADDDPSIAERLPVEGRGGVQRAAILRDGSLYVEAGASRTRLCPPAVARALVDDRVAVLLASDDLHLLLHVAALASSGGAPGSSLERLGRAKGRGQLLTHIRRLAPGAQVRLHRERDAAVLKEAGVEADVITRLFGRSGELEARAATAASIDERRRAEAARAGRLDGLLAQAASAGWVELREDVVPYLDASDEAIVEPLPTGGAPGLRHAARLADDTLHLEGGRSRVRLVPPGVAAAMLDAAGRRALEGDRLVALLELAVRSRHAPPALTVAGWLAATPARGDELLRRIHEVAIAASAGERVTRRAHVEILEAAGVPADALAAVVRGRARASAGAAAPEPATARPPAGDRLADLIAERAAQGWVEVHEDGAPYLAADHPAIVERVPARAVPWTRLIAVLDDGALHLEGGVRRVRLCPPATASRLLDQAARRLAEDDDLLRLLELAVRARRHPPRWTLAHHVASTRRAWQGLLARIRELADHPRWDGRIHRRAWLELLDEAGVSAMRRLFLEGAVRARGATTEAEAEARARRRPTAAEEAEARLLDAISDRVSRGWVSLPAGTVPYVDAGDPRVLELFSDPDGDHRFAAILEDGTVVHEGGVTRWWLVPPERAGGVVERHAWETARGGGVHGLLDLLLASAGPRAAAHPLTHLVATRDDLRQTIEDRVRAAARAGGERFTRPEHVALLRALGVAPASRGRTS